MKSMTGFGAALADELFSVEIASYNSKRLDISFDTPPSLFYLEMAMRQKISERVNRGTLKVRIHPSSKPKMGLATLKGEMEGLAKELGYSESLTFAELLAMVGKQEKFDANLEKPLLQTLEKAIDELLLTREREGKHLLDELENYNKSLKKDLTKLQELAVGNRERIQLEIAAKLKELKIELSDETRLLQEAFFLAEKRDVSEEFSRLDAHLTHFDALCKTDGPQGKMLNFLLQEMMRELNTTCAKNPSKEMVNIALGMKGVAEKMKEQVQNVE